jgi:hypothetical protein
MQLVHVWVNKKSLEIPWESPFARKRLTAIHSIREFAKLATVYKLEQMVEAVWLIWDNW